MNLRFQRILSILCVLALVFSCCALTAFAEEAAEKESRIVMVNWEDQDNYEGLRPKSVTMTIRIDHSLQEAYNALSERTNRSRNELISMALKYALDNMEIKG